MKSTKATIKLFAIGFALTLAVCACKKEQYFFDSGLNKAEFNGTILAYLKMRPEYFDTLTRVIKIAGLESTLEDGDKPVTFFAPTNASIVRSMGRLNAELKRTGRDTVRFLDQIKPELWKSYLTMYIFDQKYRLKDYPQLDTLSINAFPGQGYTSLNGRTMNIGVDYRAAGGVKYAGYRQLIISFIPDFSKPKIGLVNTPVATSDIAPNNGIIHVLNQTKHNFGFNTNLFIDDVIASGILPAQQ